MIKNKNEIKAFYELNNLNAKEIAKKFNVNYRTLCEWIQKEKWQKNSILEKVQNEVLEDKILQKEFGSLIDVKTQQIKEKIKSNLNTDFINETILNNLLENSSDKILMNALSLNFIHKNIALSAIFAKDAMIRLANERVSKKDDLMIINASEKTSKVFSELQNAVFGKNINLNAKIKVNNEVENMSDAELLEIIESESE